MPKLREEIPFSAYIAARAACEAMAAERLDGKDWSEKFLVNLDRRDRKADRDDDVVVMTIN